MKTEDNSAQATEELARAQGSAHTPMGQSSAEAAQASAEGLQGDGVRPIDQAVLELLRRSQGLTVQELIDRLHVTATAVRQRLDRLVQVEFIERRKVVAGRGRPQFRYYLTQLGMRYASASYANLALALWQEVMDMPNQALRQRILRKVGRRMGSELRTNLPEDATLSERMNAVADMLTSHRVPAGVDQAGPLPVLQVHACPYPELSRSDGQRALCELEQEMLSEAVGQALHLDSCRLDGHTMCQYRPIVQDAQPAAVAPAEAERLANPTHVVSPAAVSNPGGLANTMQLVHSVAIVPATRVSNERAKNESSQ